jgi:hypothetical protein
MSENEETTTKEQGIDIYYQALVRAASVRIGTAGVTRAVPVGLAEEMAAALGDNPSELHAYLYRRGYKTGWKSEVGFSAVWDYCNSVWPDEVEGK